MVISIIKTALNNNVIVSWSSLWGGGESTHLPKVTRKLNYKRLFPGADPEGGVIFHTKYPKNFRAFLRSAQFF